MRRRRFLGLTAAGGASLLLPAGCRRAAATPLEALVDAILPPGHGLPGGVEAGVPAYLEKTLAEPRFAGVARVIRDGLAALGPLHERLPSERLLAFAAAPPVFVNAFLDFSLEGYLGHPDRGGNRGGVVWKALGLP